MSDQTVAAVYELSTLSRGPLAVLAYLAHRTNYKSNVTWCSIETIAADMKLSQRTIERHIAKIRTSGEVYIHSGGGRHKANAYLIMLGLDEAEIKTVLTSNPDFKLSQPQAQTIAQAFIKLMEKRAKTPTEKPRQKNINPDKSYEKPRQNKQETPTELSPLQSLQVSTDSPIESHVHEISNLEIAMTIADEFGSIDPRQNIQKAQKVLIGNFVIQQNGHFNPAQWRQTFEQCVLHGKSPTNLQLVFKVYNVGGVYENLFEKGGESNANRPQRGQAQPRPNDPYFQQNQENYAAKFKRLAG